MKYLTGKVCRTENVGESEGVLSRFNNWLERNFTLHLQTVVCAGMSFNHWPISIQRIVWMYVHIIRNVPSFVMLILDTLQLSIIILPNFGSIN